MLGVNIRLASEAVEYWDSDKEPAVVLRGGEMLRADVRSLLRPDRDSPCCSRLLRPIMITHRPAPFFARSSSSQTGRIPRHGGCWRHMLDKPLERSLPATRCTARQFRRRNLELISAVRVSSCICGLSSIGAVRAVDTLPRQIYSTGPFEPGWETTLTCARTRSTTEMVSHLYAVHVLGISGPLVPITDDLVTSVDLHAP